MCVRVLSGQHFEAVLQSVALENKSDYVLGPSSLSLLRAVLLLLVVRKHVAAASVGAVHPAMRWIPIGLLGHRHQTRQMKESSTAVDSLPQSTNTSTLQQI